MKPGIPVRRGPSNGVSRNGDAPRRFSRGPRLFVKKSCRLCAEKPVILDFKDTEKLRKFLTEKGKIIPRRITGNCAKCQRILARAIKRARHAGVIAFQMD